MSLSATTFVSRSWEQILRQLTTLPHLSSASSSQTLLFSLSPAPDLPQDALSALVRILTQQPGAIGCLSAPLRPRGAALTPTVCSVAALDGARATPFRSTLPGKEPTQVGRWHAFRKRDDRAPLEPLPQEAQGVDWEAVWAKQAAPPPLPAELRALGPEDVQAVLYFSDSAPEGLVQALSRFEKASKLGLIASSTPFITGRPHTLFYGSDVHSTGAVGIALTSNDAAKPKLEVQFPELSAIEDKLFTVTDTEGNMVNALDDQNPSRIILSAVEKLNGKPTPTNVDLGIKEDEFFLGVHRDGKLYQLYTIQGGDPSRGTIALQSDAAPETGSQVKIYRKSVNPDMKNRLREGLNLITALPEGSMDLGGNGSDDDHVTVLQGSFLATSENGFVVSRARDGEPCERPWNSTVVGGHATIDWDH
ncbi:hypothetical protein PsYK624_079650 [Phanerochaete sordida]|uniref:FIST domain-containing protein n=1 Tax=Phanerochaete sordida TaxID=48140 RepID=A0A9P3GCF9_9APHY|nr:hypothetical protein PsYK624_079650 [Phanerochaete sordida]